MKSISAEERSYPDRPNFSVYAKYFILCLQHIKKYPSKSDSVQFYLAYVK